MLPLPSAAFFTPPRSLVRPAVAAPCAMRLTSLGSVAPLALQSALKDILQTHSVPSISVATDAFDLVVGEARQGGGSRLRAVLFTLERPLSLT